MTASSASINDINGTWISASVAAGTDHIYTDIFAEKGTYEHHDLDAAKLTAGAVVFSPKADPTELGTATLTPDDGSKAETFAVRRTDSGLIMVQGSEVMKHRVDRLACYTVELASEEKLGKALNGKHYRGFEKKVPAVDEIDVYAGQTLLLRYDLTEPGAEFRSGDDWIDWGTPVPEWVSGIQLSKRVVLVFDRDPSTNKTEVRYSFTLRLEGSDAVDPVIVNKGTPPP